jgi:hypothetical protein
MSITNASIKLDGTVAATGGTDTTFIVKANDSKGLEVILDDGSEFISQTTLLFQTKEPKPNASSPNGYTQARNIVTIKRPLLLDDGSYTVRTVKVEIADDHETTDAEQDTIRSLIAQVLTDSDFDDYWHKQSRS